MAAELCRDWSSLVGVPVRLHLHGKYIRSGVIDAAMPDSSILWLAADGADERQMFEAALGYQAWICPGELTGDLRFKMAKNTLAAVDENAVDDLGPGRRHHRRSPLQQGRGSWMFDLDGEKSAKVAGSSLPSVGALANIAAITSPSPFL